MLETTPMSETDVNIDAPTRRRRRMTATLVLGTVLFVGAIPVLLPVSCITIMGFQLNAERNRLITEVDHIAIRDAGRVLLTNHDANCFIDLTQLPNELARLGPKHVSIDHRGFLHLEFGGGFHHHGLLVVPQTAEQIQLDTEPPLKFTPLADGIWYYKEI